MTNFHNLTGLAGVTLAITASLMWVPPFRRLKRFHLGLLMGATAIVAAVPMGRIPLAAYVRTLSGDLSITTIVFLMLAIFSRFAGSRPVDGKQQFAMVGLIGGTALVYYPLALGFGPFDPYRSGFGSLWLLAGLLLLALRAWVVRFHLISICVALSVFAHAVSWYDSTNLWDYLLDPLVSLYALGALLTGALRTITHPGGQNRHELPTLSHDGGESMRGPEGRTGP